jgi:hypothetical protein
MSGSIRLRHLICLRMRGCLASIEIEGIRGDEECMSPETTGDAGMPKLIPRLVRM